VFLYAAPEIYSRADVELPVAAFQNVGIGKHYRFLVRDTGFEPGRKSWASGGAAFAPKDSCKLEMTGRWPAYDVTLEGGWIFLSIQLMDQGDPPESPLSVGDGSEGWRTSCKPIAALERNQINSLSPRPIEIGEPGSPDSWVIG
jgi:hypothetical protein